MADKKRSKGSAVQLVKEEEIMPPVTFPIWPGDDAIKQKEYFNQQEAKSFKEAKTVKWPYEDITGQIFLPFDTRKATWQRPDQCFVREEGSEHVVVSPARFELVEFQRITTETEVAWLRKKNMEYPPIQVEQSADLLKCNSELMHSSELMRTILTHLSELQHAKNLHDPHSVRPWELIWPQIKTASLQSVPSYNPAGKYVVKLFWLGAWRRIGVDDLIPVVNEKVQLPCSSLDMELWPMIITKAICKVAHMYYEDVGNNGCEFGDVEILQLLTGWQAQRLTVATNATSNVGATLLMHKFCSSQQHELKPVDIKDAEPEPVVEENSSLLKPKLTKKDGPRSGRKSVSREKSRPSLSATAIDEKTTTRPTFDPAIVESMVYIGAQLRSSTAVDSDVNSLRSEQPHNITSPILDDATNHHVRVVECVYIPHALHGTKPNPTDLNNWIVRCRSQLSVFKGKFDYTDTTAWTNTVLLGSGVSPERLSKLNETAILALEEGKPSNGVDWHMSLAEFYAHFGSIAVHHKIEAEVTTIVESTKEGRFASVRDKMQGQVEPERDPKAPEVLDYSATQPYFLCCDSAVTFDVVASLTIAPTHPPSKLNDIPTTPSIAEDNPQTTADGSGGDEETKAQLAPFTLGSGLEKTGVVLEPYIWHAHSARQPLAKMFTKGSTSTTLSIPAGRHVFKIASNVPGTFSLSATVAKAFQGKASLKDEKGMMQFFTEDSIRMQIAATEICKIFDKLFHDGPNPDVLTLVLTATKTAVADATPDFFRTLWQALLSSVALSFQGLGGGESGEFDFNDKEGHPAHLGMVWMRTSKLFEQHCTAAVRPPTQFTPYLDKSHIPSLSEEEAAIVLQSHWRRILDKAIIEAVRLAKISADRELFLKSWELLYKNQVDFGVLFFRRWCELNPVALDVFDFINDERHRAVYHQIAEGAAADDCKELGGMFEEKEANAYFVLFVDTVVFEKKTTCSAALRLGFPEAFRETTEAAVHDSFSLIVMDNDTFTTVPAIFGETIPCEFVPNKNGYTFFASGRASVALPKSQWVVRLLSSHDFPLQRALTTTIPQEERTGPFVCKAKTGSGTTVVDVKTGISTIIYDVLFRFDIVAVGEFPPPRQVCAFELASSPDLPNAVVELELSKDGETLLCASARQAVALSCVSLLGSNPPMAVDAKKDKGAKKGKSASRKDSGRTPSTEPDAAEVPTVLHNYVLRGRILSGKPVEETIGGASTPVKKKGKGKPEGPFWKLQVFATQEVRISEHTQREEAIDREKAGWEAVDSAPGRAERAETERQKYLATYAPPASEEASDDQEKKQQQWLRQRDGVAAEVFDDTTQEQRDRERIGVIKDYRRVMSAKRVSTKASTARRSQFKRDHLDKLASTTIARNQMAIEINSKRTQFRDRILEEDASREALETMRLTAIEAEQVVREANEPGGGKAKGKKKK